MGLTVALVNTTPVQNVIARRAAYWLSQKLNTKVLVAHVRIDFLNHMALQGLYIEDKAHDTLLYAGEARVRITDWFVFSKKPVFHYVSLTNSYAHLYRKKNSAEWNYDFIAKAFETNDKKPHTADTSVFEFALEQVALNNVRFHFDDEWGGEDMDFDIGKLDLNANTLDFRKKLIDIEKIAMKNVVVSMKEYEAGKPRTHPQGYIPPIDTTPFNPDLWTVLIKKLSLEGSEYYLTASDRVPVPGLFDEDHLVIKEIKTDIKDISIIGDTIRGQSLGLYARERCGIVIKTLRSKVTISPVASICEELYLETNNCKLHDYYAMRYKHFPNFLDYIDSVVMEGHLDKSIVDTRDIAYFAPELKALPAILTVTGSGKGTVANLKCHGITVADGRSVIRGDLSMKGLPDIYKTYITYNNGEIFTTGESILKYAPSLRGSPTIALEAITHAYYKGSYTGYIDNFLVNGILTTNLGSLATTNVRLSMPYFKSNLSTYSGIIATDKA
ncbi:MAG: hypothetical protein H7257_00340, partial [Taibaiella sp.]|nr:hypothetical protein [Taibaiella sp.]